MRLLLESDKYYFLSRLVSPILVVFFFLFFYFLRMLVTTNLSSSAFYFDLLFSLNVNIFLIFTSLFFANGNVTALTLTCLTTFFNGKLPYDIKDFQYSTQLFSIFISEKWIRRPSKWNTTSVYRGNCQCKVTVTLVKTKRVQIPAFHARLDLQIRDKVQPIIKVKIVGESNTQDEKTSFFFLFFLRQPMVSKNPKTSKKNIWIAFHAERVKKKCSKLSEV